MRLRRQFNGEVIIIETDAPLGKGGEARVYGVQGEPGLAAKVYESDRNLTERIAKLTVMRALPPDLPEGKDRHVPIAWPLDLLCDVDDASRVTGFLMGRVHDAVQVIDVYNPQTRLRECPLFDYRYLLRAARNLSAAVRACHSRGYIIGDLKHSNVLVTQTALVTLVDTDSFQVRDPHTGQLFACLVRTPDFTPPELQEEGVRDKGKGVSEDDCLTPYLLSLTPSHDLFALAVLNFHLLMEGTHPFAGVYLEEGDPPPFEERIARGHFPYGNRAVPYRANTRYAPPFEMLPPGLRELFVRCFEDGHDDPELRPDARTWQRALDEAARNLSRCDANPQHFYSNHLEACPWCVRKQTQLRGLDPFPSEEAVQANLNSQLPVPRGSVSVSRSEEGYQAPPASPTLSTGEAMGWLGFIGGLALFCSFIIFAIATDKHHNSYMAESHKDEPFTSFTTNEIAPALVAPLTVQTAASSPFASFASPAPVGTVWQVSYSPDGKTILGSGNSIVLWDARSGKTRGHFSNGGNFTHYFACSPDGTTLAAMDTDGRVKLWDIRTGRSRVHLGSGAGYSYVMFSHDGKLLAAGKYGWKTDSHSAIRVWDTHTGAKIRDFEMPARDIPRMAFSPVADTLASCVNSPTMERNARPVEGRIDVWNARTGQLRYTLEQQSPTAMMQFSRNGKSIFASGWPPRRWQAQTGITETFPSYSLAGDGFTFSPREDRVANILATHEIEVLNTATGTRMFVLPALSTSGRALAATGGNDYVGYTSMAFAPDGNRLVTGSYTQGIQIWDAHTGKLLRTLDDSNDKTQVTASGLKYVDMVMGTGEMPRLGQQITVHYVGKFTDGTVFDSSYKHTDPQHPAGQPFKFILGEQVIPAWNEGIATMRVGGKRRLICPPALAYGKSGMGAMVPPNATLIFDVELLQVGSYTFP